MTRYSPIILIALGAGCAGSDTQGPPVDPAAAVRLSEHSISVGLDDTHPLTAQRLGADGAAIPGRIRWRSANEHIATVDDEGRVSAVGLGRTWIVASDTRHTDTALVDTWAAFREIHAGEDFTCGLAGRGTVLCWGWNQFGSLGDGSGRDRPLPGLVGGGLHFSGLSVGSASACGISGSALWCWGYNGVGQLGDGTTVQHGTPERIADTLRLGSIALGAGTTTCAFDLAATTVDRPAQPDPQADTSTTRNVVCWGWNGFGQLLDGGGANARRPKRLNAAWSFFAIAPGGHHVCGLDLTGVAWCWGRDDSGQLGDGATTLSTVPRPVAGRHAYGALVSGILHTCGRTASGQVWCWGDNSRGQTGTAVPGFTATPVLAAGGMAFDVLSSSSYHNCGLAAGVAWCWGDNSSGQLGRGTISTTGAPAPVAGNLRFQSISAGRRHTCGITTDGVAWCWGGNARGGLGYLTDGPQSTPGRVAAQR